MHFKSEIHCKCNMFYFSILNLMSAFKNIKTPDFPIYFLLSHFFKSYKAWWMPVLSECYCQLFSVLKLLFLAGDCDQISQVSRAGWGARPPAGTLSPLNTPVDIVFIHHTVTPECYNQEDCSYWMRSIQDFHIDGNGMIFHEWRIIACKFYIRK